jgi:hypothetical protein
VQVDPDGRLDVMVWFHGGGFVSGAGSFYGPEHLLDEDIVLVTVNYRLGPIGKDNCINWLTFRILPQYTWRLCNDAVSFLQELECEIELPAPFRVKM